MKIGFDLDGVVSPLSIVVRQVYAKNNGEKLLWRAQKMSSVLQRVYNLFFRRVNKNVCSLMKLLKTKGDTIVIVSACAGTNRQFLSKWLEKNKIPVDELYLRDFLSESAAEFKKRILEQIDCFFYLEDKEEIVEEINLNSKRARAFLYKQEDDSSLRDFLLAILGNTVQKPAC